jgi:hypothetical protein
LGVGVEGVDSIAGIDLVGSVEGVEGIAVTMGNVSVLGKRFASIFSISHLFFFSASASRSWAFSRIR